MGLNCSAFSLGEHRLGHLVGGVGPDLDFLLAPLVVGDDPAVELLLDLLRFLLALVEDPGLGDRGPHVSFPFRTKVRLICRYCGG